MKIEYIAVVLGMVISQGQWSIMSYSVISDNSL